MISTWVAPLIIGFVVGVLLGGAFVMWRCIVSHLETWEQWENWRNRVNEELYELYERVDSKGPW